MASYSDRRAKEITLQIIAIILQVENWSVGENIAEGADKCK